MHFSLMRLHRFLTKASYARPVMAAVVTLAMLFALTPCCEVNAAPSLAPSSIHSGSDGHDHGAGHGDDRNRGMPPTIDPCLMWVENNFNALNKTAVLSIPGHDPHPVLFAASWSTPPAGETPPRLQLYDPSPPHTKVPLYLLIERLLI